jgi:hypothetical protein
MALTFGTLLSSQGAVAHRHGPFGPIGGNPRNSTRFDRPGQPGDPYMAVRLNADLSTEQPLYPLLFQQPVMILNLLHP